MRGGFCGQEMQDVSSRTDTTRRSDVKMVILDQEKAQRAPTAQNAGLPRPLVLITPNHDGMRLTQNPKTIIWHCEMAARLIYRVFLRTLTGGGGSSGLASDARCRCALALCLSHQSNTHDWSSPNVAEETQYSITPWQHVSRQHSTHRPSERQRERSH